MSAQVRSFEAIEQVRDQLAKFAHRSADAIDGLAGEIRRTIDWVEHDRPAYWRERERRAHDAVTEAKAALHRCLMYPINDEQPSCAEERAALKKAQAHLQHCREKQERVRGWAQTLRHELHEYEGRISTLRTLIDSDTPRAVALLERALASLEKYVSGGPAAGASKGPAAEDSVEEEGAEGEGAES